MITEAKSKSKSRPKPKDNASGSIGPMGKPQEKMRLLMAGLAYGQQQREARQKQKQNEELEYKPITEKEADDFISQKLALGEKLLRHQRERTQ